MTEMAGGKGAWGGLRKGAGRPAVLKDPVDCWIRLERRDAEAAKKLADSKQLSLSEVMRRALSSYLKRQKRK